jgi:hypothetical protein
VHDLDGFGSCAPGVRVAVKLNVPVDRSEGHEQCIHKDLLSIAHVVVALALIFSQLSGVMCIVALILWRKCDTHSSPLICTKG